MRNDAAALDARVADSYAMSDIELARQLHVLLSESSSEQALSSFFEELDARIAEIAHADDPQRRHDFQEVLEHLLGIFSLKTVSID